MNNLFVALSERDNIRNFLNFQYIQKEIVKIKVFDSKGLFLRAWLLSFLCYRQAYDYHGNDPCGSYPESC
jgi:hypothetical protein